MQQWEIIYDKCLNVEKKHYLKVVERDDTRYYDLRYRFEDNGYTKWGINLSEKSMGFFIKKFLTTLDKIVEYKNVDEKQSYKKYCYDSEKLFDNNKHGYILKVEFCVNYKGDKIYDFNYYNGQQLVQNGGGISIGHDTALKLIDVYDLYSRAQQKKKRPIINKMTSQKIKELYKNDKNDKTKELENIDLDLIEN
jgi:hypothetical protein